ncbi:MAG TPA: alkaline phosphatase family protein [Ktedonobacteraceae bacterium]|nr:alkaline phosphatase family protein [Ktedonobacteraceae bacterium]
MKGFRGQNLLVRVLIVALLVGVGAYAFTQVRTFAHATAASKSATTGCQLNAPQGKVKHVIYLQFDNVHLSRDNANVPSDLEQMPNLLNFMKHNGVMMSNNHTPLIAHTATDFLTSLTGVYPDRNGMAESNSYGYYKPDGSTGFASSFAYWTAPLFDKYTNPPTDTTYNLLTAQGKNAPAPWVPYTRAGCNFGTVGMANTALENTGIDIPTVFGANSAEAAEAKANPSLAQTDYVGIAVHCAQGSSVCATANNGKTDALPDEPGGYHNFQALYGHKYVAPQISPNGPLKDLNGNVIQDYKGNPGFPGFGGLTASTSLAYVAAMQEHNVPITYAYMSDAHDNPNGNAYGPGEAGYVARLKSYDQAFGTFFTRLTKDGINASNTLFVVTADEGDHFIGGAPSPANCNGVTLPCNYSQIGELTTNLTGLLATQKGIKTPFDLHYDSAPMAYLTGNPARDAAVTRQFEQAVASLTEKSPLNGKTQKLANYLADPVELKLLHMVTADPARTPTFTLFANPDYYVQTGAADCTQACIYEDPGYAWNHGDISPDINRTWLAFAGPGVKQLGVDNTTWADHTDTRPTMMALLGLKDDYAHDGRVLFEVMQNNALPPAVRDHLSFYIHLAQVYKQLNAPVGALSMVTWRISTRALASHSAGDRTYNQLENQLQLITEQRNGVTSQMIAALESAEFGHANPSTRSQQSMLTQANALQDRVVKMAAAQQ